MNLLEAEEGKTYIVSEINTNDDEMTAFLFRLGCYEGEPVTLISKKRKGCVVAIKDGRYSLDKQLASAVLVEANN
jgi:ferrous iron transport protein A